MIQSPADFPLPTIADFRAMPPDDFERFWRMYRAAFPPDKGKARSITIALNLRLKGWEIVSCRPAKVFPEHFVWRHPKKHHSNLAPDIAHELDARGWLEKTC